MPFENAFQFLLAILLGAVIGLEREAHQKTERGAAPEKTEVGGLGGVRTFALISLLGAIGGFLSAHAAFSFFLLLSGAFFLLLCAYYIVDAFLSHSTGLTTEISAMLVFIIGFFTTTNILPTHIVVALTVVLGIIMAMKENVQFIIRGIQKSEIQGFLSFALIALVILPFLPNSSFALSSIPGIDALSQTYGFDLGRLRDLELLNPFKLWFIVALITGIEVLGYILTRIVGKERGVFLSSIAGGFISSTSTTQSLAQQSKKYPKETNTLVAAAIFANLASFFQIFILLAPLNGRLLAFLTPILVVVILSALIVGLFFKRLARGEKRHQPTTKNEVNEASDARKNIKIFSLLPALKFALLLLIVRFVTKLSLAFFGQKGFLASSIIASFAGIDAIMINLAEVAEKSISLKSAALTFIAINATNLLSKVVYSFIQGKREFSLKLAGGMFTIIAASIIGYIFI